MKGIVLINNAIFADVFKRIAVNLKNEGIDILIVTDSVFTIKKYSLEKTGCRIRCFELFHDNNLIDNKNLLDKWNIHADYDRDNYYNSIYTRQKNFWGETSSNLISFFENVFSSEKFNFCFYENVSNGLAYTAYTIARKYDVHYLGLTASRLPGKALFSALDEDIAENIAKNFNDSLQSVAMEKKTEIYNYIENIQNIQPDYMKSNGLSSTNFFSKIFKKRDLSAIASTLHCALFGNKAMFQIGNPLLKSYHMNLREIKRWICVKKIRKLFSDELDAQPFFLYPLHYHPESSTSILANFYDEYNLIKNIAFSIPHGYTLVIKDHISATGYEGLNFYKKLKKLPNVKIANPNLNAKDLVKKALGTFTLTSTVGYEAILMNKPVAVFGDVFYMKHPLVFKCSGYNDIKCAILRFLSFSYKDYLEYNMSFIAAYDSLCFPLSINYSKPVPEQFIHSVTQEIIKKIKGL